MRTTFARIKLGAGVCLLATAACSSAPADTTGLASVDPLFASVTTESLRSKPLPSPTLAVPAGNNLAFAYEGVGVQIYACQATAAGFAWVFQAPQATLFDCRGHVVGKHYAGPTWESTDGSTVVAAKLAGFTADVTAIPWLLLQAASHTGDGVMSDVTYVQRLSTVGGLAPATGCDADHLGDIASVDYSAIYAFSAAAADH